MRLGMQNIKFEFNFKKYICTWQDINSADNPWNNQDDIMELRPAICKTLGYVYNLETYKADGYITMFATWSEDHNAREFGDICCIPNGCIVSLTQLSDN